MSAVLENSGNLADGRQLIGLVAGACSAMLAANGGWRLTDWVMARREGAR
ncbi:hypothetical protein [Actinocorallia libanotica]